MRAEHGQDDRPPRPDASGGNSDRVAVAASEGLVVSYNVRGTGAGGIPITAAMLVAREKADRGTREKVRRPMCRLATKHLNERVHGEKNVECAYKGCKQTFATNGLANGHFKLVHGEKDVECAYEGCKQMFATSAGANGHFKLVHGEKSVECAYKGCKQMFATSAASNRHFKLVHGEKNVECAYKGCE